MRSGTCGTWWYEFTFAGRPGGRWYGSLVVSLGGWPLSSVIATGATQ